MHPHLVSRGAIKWSVASALLFPFHIHSKLAFYFHHLLRPKPSISHHNVHDFSAVRIALDHVAAIFGCAFMDLGMVYSVSLQTAVAWWMGYLFKFCNKLRLVILNGKGAALKEWLCSASITRQAGADQAELSHSIGWYLSHGQALHCRV